MPINELKERSYEIMKQKRNNMDTSENHSMGRNDLGDICNDLLYSGSAVEN